MRFYKNIFHMLAIASMLSLLAAALPISPVLAASEDIDLDPGEGEVGDRVDIDGQDFEASYYSGTIYYESGVDIYFSDEEADEGDEIDDEVENYERVKSGVWVDQDGEFRTYFYVPDELTDGDKDEDVRGGTYYVYVTYEDDDDIVVVAKFKVIAGEIEIDPEDGVVGDEVEVTGTGFGDGEDIEIEYDGDDITDDIIDGEAETDSDGEFEFTFIVPQSTAGDHTLTVTDESSSEAEATFTVEPQITVNPTSGGVGSAVSVNGTGFGDEVEVTVTLGGEWVVKEETDDTGSFTTSFIVPGLTPGRYDIEVEDEDDNYAEVEFNLSLSASISPITSAASPGNVGTELTVSGVGFTTGGPVTVKYDTIQVGATIADAKGAFSVTFIVPSSKSGEHVVSVSDGINARHLGFIMESEPPPVPTPLQPEMDVRAKSLTHFDWGDSTDPSGVTYTLQIATDKSFGSGSIVLEKTGLADSEYTITKVEKLKSVSNKAPYYWRVKAIDAASNESGWSGAGSFYVGTNLIVLLYIVIGLFVLILLAIAYFLGKRAGQHSSTYPS